MTLSGGADPRDALLARGDTQQGLRGRTQKAIRWTFGTQAAAFSLQILSTVVLARLLTPEDFGLMGMAMAVTAFLAQFLGLGLSHAAVQSREVSHEQASNLFWINLLLGTGIAALVAACSPLIAAFYRREELVPVTMTLSLVFVLTALGIQHNAILLRQLRLKAVALRELVARGTGIAAGIALAAAGAGYWALVVNQLVTAVITCVFLWTATSWRPGLPRRRVPMRDLLRVGSGHGVFSVLQYLTRNADNILIGRVFGAADLGLYTRAYALFLLPLRQLGKPVSSMANATLCALWPEPQRFRRYYSSALTGLALVGMPFVVYTAVMSPEIIRFALGDRWLGVVDVFRVLAVAGLFSIVSLSTHWLYIASGQTWRQARFALWSQPLIVLSFFAGLPWGIVGVAAAFTIAQGLLMPFEFANAVKGTPVRLSDVARACWRPLLLALVMGGLCLAVKEVLDVRSAVLSLAVTALAAAVYWAAVLTVWPHVRRDVATLVSRSRTA